MATTVDEETGEIIDPDAQDNDALTEEVETDDLPDLEPEPEPEEETAPLSEKEIEAMMRKLDTEATRHANRVSELLGAEAQTLIPCAMCATNIPGFYFVESLTEEHRAAVMAALGVADEEELTVDPETQMCEHCGGHGQTITGSKVANQVTRPCPKCLAAGWLSKEAMRSAAIVEETRIVAAQVTGAPVETTQVTYDLPSVDAWTRPRGHANYGKNPVYMDASERAADWPGAQ